MSTAFSVDPDGLGAHAAELDAVSVRVREASAAAGTTFSEDAFGRIGGRLAGGANESAGRLRAVLEGWAGSVTGHADGVRGCAADYRTCDHSLAEVFEVLR